MSKYELNILLKSRVLAFVAEWFLVEVEVFGFLGLIVGLLGSQ